MEEEEKREEEEVRRSEEEVKRKEYNSPPLTPEIDVMPGPVMNEVRSLHLDIDYN